MTQQEIEEAINAKTIGDRIIAYDTLVKIAAIHLSIMKSGVPKKKKQPGTYSITDANLPYRIIGYNQAINDFTAYLAQQEAERNKKLEGEE